jgi:hypothetical protein
MDKSIFSRQKINEESMPRAIIAKWGSAALIEGFVPFPKRLLRCLNQVFEGKDAIERLMVVMAIADYRRPNLTRGPSREFLSFLTDLSVERVGSILEELRSDGFITVLEKDEDELDIGIDGLLARIATLTAGEKSPSD